jgi:hypothetical protein
MRYATTGGRILAALLMLAFSTMASAQAEEPRAALERLLRTDTVPSDWFAQSFLAQVPAAKVTETIADLKQRYGMVERIDGAAPQFTVRLERAEIPATIALDADGRIVGLLFGVAVPVGGSVETHAAAIAGLPGHHVPAGAKRRQGRCRAECGYTTGGRLRGKARDP